MVDVTHLNNHKMNKWSRGAIALLKQLIQKLGMHDQIQRLDRIEGMYYNCFHCASCSA